MSQIPIILYPQTSPKVFSVGTIQNEGPVTGKASPDDLSDYETISGNFSLFYKGGKIGTVYELVIINGKKVVKEVGAYAAAMIKSANEDGIELKITSGFRTMGEQKSLFDRNNDSILISKPGYCSHQTGISLDFNISDKEGRVYEWLVKNAYRFGFIRTVPSERWHWEYWGDWSGQARPPWAGGPRKGTNRLKHRRLCMFSKVPKIHSCGDKKFGGSFTMLPAYWWSSYGALATHTDTITSGATNSWIGFSNEFLPDKLDRESPHWDKRKF
jgi:hypothetical protein